jgi:hypothetical protein
LDTPASSANTANTQLNHPLVWGFYTQDEPDVIHIRDYGWSLLIEMISLDGQVLGMCGHAAEWYEEPRIDRFILGNKKICKNCLTVYTRRRGVQSTE